MKNPPFSSKIYLKAVTSASIVFGSTHGIEEFVHGFNIYNIINIKFSALMMLFVFEVLQSLAFFVFCSFLMLVPTKVTLHIYNTRSVFPYIFLGAIFALAFLPLCALVANTVLPLPDMPTYFERCVEFLLPMITAGAVGGYVFWRELGLSTNLNKSITDLFS